MNTLALRDVGPRVFLSYSFQDKETAGRVASFLAGSGCRVRMEDETSLIGHRLDEVLPERIGDAEAFLQVRTRSASESFWVAKEMEYASAERAQPPQLVVVSLDLEGVASHADRAVTATSGLSDDVLNVVLRRVLGAIHLMPLSREDPFRFDPEALERALSAAPVDRRRIVVDSDGRLLEWMNDTLSYIETCDAPHKQRWLEQERGSDARLRAFLNEIDREVARLIDSLVEAYQSWKCPYPGNAAKALDYFALVRLGLAVVERAAQAPPAHPDLRVKYADKFASLLAVLPGDTEVHDAYLKWRAGGDYYRRAPSDEDFAATRALERVGIDDKAFAYFAQEARSELEEL